MSHFIFPNLYQVKSSLPCHGFPLAPRNIFMLVKELYFVRPLTKPGETSLSTVPNTHRNSSLQPSMPRRAGQGLSFRRATACSPLIKMKVKCRALSVREVSRGTEVRASGLGSLAELELERKLHSRRAHDYRCNR